MSQHARPPFLGGIVPFIPRPALCALPLALAAAPAMSKTLIDYFLPTPVIKQTTSNAWGSAGVLPRDQDNGVEDKTNKSYSYWDGKILQAKDGKYHMHVSRWNQSAGHNGWFGSVCVHTVSDSSPLGPYVDKGLCYNDQNGKGHNVMVEQMNDGTYFVLVSETRRPATVYTSKSLDGPWVAKGTMFFEKNGFNIDVGSGSQLHSNTVILPRPDGSFLSIAREGVISLSTNGILGPYKVMTKSVFPIVQGLNNGFAEDPVIWRSGGKYHITVNWWDAKQARHVMSDDGINNWKDMGVAYIPSRDFIKYTNGVVNHWTKIERPQVFLKDGHVTHFTFSVIDVEKDKDGGNDNHNSKVIVVPFDGLQFDKDHGWVPTATEPKAPVSQARHAILQRDGGFVLECSGYAAGNAEFGIHDHQGRLLARKDVALGSQTSFAWKELAALPKGTYLTRVRIDGVTAEGSTFVKF
jgi:hypothetical protein